MSKLWDFVVGRTSDGPSAQVEIYTWQTCPYCIRAKVLLRWKGVRFTDYRIDGDGGARLRMADRANGARTLPQIFINQQHVGGYDDLYRLDAQGQLDQLLASGPLND
jgi:glutaredoxin 3